MFKNAGTGTDGAMAGRGREKKERRSQDEMHNWFLNPLLTRSSAGYDNLGSYAFNTKTKSHQFCKSCGSSILIDFLRSEQGETDPAKDILAVNVSFLILSQLLEVSK